MHTNTIAPSSTKSLTAKFYGFAFLQDFILIYPFYALLFTDRGLSPAQITILFMVWSGTAFILEVPSGAVADKFDRRTVLVLALLLQVAGFSSWLMFPSFEGFLAGFVLWGISGSLISGTKEALLYDELARIGQLPQYAKITGRMESFGLAGVLLSAFIASALVHRGYSFLLALSVVASLLAVIPVLLLPKSRIAETVGETRYLKYLTGGLRDALGRPAILLIVLFASIASGLEGGVDEYSNLLLREKSFDNASIALWTAAIGLCGIAGSLIAHRFQHRRLPLEPVLALMGVSLLAAATFQGVRVPLLLGLFTAAFYVVKVLYTTHLQEAVRDKTRATSTSVMGVFTELATLLLFALVGSVAQVRSYSLTLAILSVATIVIALGLWTFGHFTSRPNEVSKL